MICHHFLLCVCVCVSLSLDSRKKDIINIGINSVLSNLIIMLLCFFSLLIVVLLVMYKAGA